MLDFIKNVKLLASSLAWLKRRDGKNSMGFTLVELSIVIVIIGLLVGGVVAGQNLVKTAKMSAQITDLNKFESAYYAFKLQYNAIPGDMRNASSYWPGSTDGDGNGRNTYTGDVAYNGFENLGFFEHLSLAKLVPETYTNVWQLGVGYPALKLNSGYGMVAGGSISGCCGSNVQLSDAETLRSHVTVLYLNVAYPSLANSGFNDFLGVASPITFAAIDKKTDDGAARTGKFKSYRAYNSTVGNCLTADNGDYLLTVTTDSCHAEFIIAK